MEKIKRILNIIFAVGVVLVIIGLFMLIPESVSNADVTYYTRHLVSVLSVGLSGILLIIGSITAKYCFSIIWEKLDDIRIENQRFDIKGKNK